MGNSTIRRIAPYVAGLIIAVTLYVLAARIEYRPRPGVLGPDTWPKMAVVLLGVTCLFEIVRGLAGAREARGIESALDPDSDGEEQSGTHPWLLAGGIALLAAYAVLVPVLGFLLATFLFLALFMYLGRYRKHVAVWSTAAGVTVLVALLFLRIAYVSLPRGMPPFDRFTDFVRVMLGG
jgi:hypothetical protein